MHQAQQGFILQIKIQATPAMSTSLSRYYHLCRSDFSFPFFLYISLHFNSFVCVEA